jgi:deoxyribodipyrimidine photolyase
MWFRQDLRLHDNQAFHAAVRAAKRRGGDVLCVYVWSEEEEGDDAASWRPGGASRAWLRHALDALDRDLRRRYGGGVAGLTYMRGAHADALRAAMRAADASAVFASERFEPAHVANDARVTAALARENLSVTLLPGHLLFDPRATDIDMGAEKYYFGTLMPYVHAAEKTGGKPGVPRPAPPAAPLAGAGDAASAARVAARLRAECEKNATSGVSVAPDVDALGVLPASDAALDWSRGIRAAWDISEAGAEEAWSHFKRANLARYEDDASLTEEDASAVSRLSPYLRFGQISPRRVYHELSVAEKPTGSGSGSRNRRGSNASDKGPSTKTGRQLSRTFWHRLYRREFAYWQLAHWPRLATRSVRAHYEDRADWRLAWTEADDKRVAARGGLLGV